MQKLTYETETCTHCGGTGRFSYNAMHGDRCFKCGGSGKQRTKRGAAARAYANTLLEIKIEDVPEGTLFSYSDALAGRQFWFCTSVKTTSDWVGPNGRPVAVFDVRTRDGDTVWCIGSGTRVRLVPSPNQIKIIREYQDSLTKAGKPRKR
jgi:hypothetical protein